MTSQFTFVYVIFFFKKVIFFAMLHSLCTLPCFHPHGLFFTILCFSRDQRGKPESAELENYWAAPKVHFLFYFCMHSQTPHLIPFFTQFLLPINGGRKLNQGQPSCCMSKPLFSLNPKLLKLLSLLVENPTINQQCNQGNDHCCDYNYNLMKMPMPFRNDPLQDLDACCSP